MRNPLCDIAVLCLLPLASSSLAQDPAAPPADRSATGRVEGRVLGPLGEPTLDVEVLATIWPDLDTPIARSRTDGDGNFVLGGLPLRTITVLAKAPGHTTGRAAIRLSPETRLGGNELRLWQANTLSGRILDPEGRPIPGALVIGAKDKAWIGYRTPEATSDAEGKFELAGVPVGDCVVRAWAQGFGTIEHRLTATTDTSFDLTLKLGAGTELTVKIRGLAPGDDSVRVRAYPTRGGTGFAFPEQLESGPVDADGVWRRTGLPDAEWNVTIESDRYGFDPRRHRFEAGETEPTLEVTATPVGSLTLQGILRTRSGEPIAGQQLLCRTQRSQSMNGGYPGRATTDAEGHFSLDAPLASDEPYSLHLVDSPWVLYQKKVDGHTGESDARYLVRYEDTADPDRELELVAVRAAVVRCQLVSTTGQPVPFQWTELKIRRPANWSPGWDTMSYATSGRDGWLEFPGVHAVDTDVRVETSGAGGAAVSGVLRLEAGETHEVTVKVQAPGVIRGVARDAAGKPLAGEILTLRDYDLETGQGSGDWADTTTNRKGEFAFVGVSPGGHRVVLGMHGSGRWHGTTETFEVPAGGSVDVRIKADG